MIHDEIVDRIENYLRSELGLSTENILYSNQIPDKEVNYFVRFVWTFGDTSEFLNNSYLSQDILSLEFFEKKFHDEDIFYPFILEKRMDMKKNFNLITFQNDIAKCINLRINNNDQDPIWNNYSLSLTYNFMRQL